MNDGLVNEKRIIKSYNNKKFSQLNDFQKEVIKTIFSNIKDEDMIFSNICNRYSKPDIYFEVNNIRKYISIKSGRSDSMHFESIKSFVLFLRGLGVSNRTQKIILLFHYGDSSLDGTGTIRLCFEEIMKKYSNYIQEANEEINKIDIVKKSLDRFVFMGIESKTCFVDYIYYGNEKYGILCSKEKMVDFVLKKKYGHLKTLHIGPMTIQPFLRDVKRVSKNVYKRNMVQVKWHYLLTDMQKINK